MCASSLSNGYHSSCYVSTVCVVLLSQVSGVKSDIRLIYQFHFTAWPDHGVPKYATPLLEFQKKVDKLHKCKNNKSMLVHCRYVYQLYNIPYSGFYLRGPNFCEICEVLTTSQILILYSYFAITSTFLQPREPAKEHVIYISPRLSQENITYRKYQSRYMS